MDKRSEHVTVKAADQAGKTSEAGSGVAELS
jgi:hypothetical protein